MALQSGLTPFSCSNIWLSFVAYTYSLVTIQHLKSSIQIDASERVKNCVECPLLILERDATMFQRRKPKLDEKSRHIQPGKKDQKSAYEQLKKAIKSDPRSVAGLLGDNPGILNTKDENGDTLLHIAVIENNPSIVSLLIAKGADVNAPGEEGYTPLHHATAVPDEQLSLQNKANIIAQLLNSGADLDKPGEGHAAPRAKFEKDIYLCRLVEKERSNLLVAKPEPESEPEPETLDEGRYCCLQQ